jgi:predicted molibdopterin-dependent oxidoreductase YjgC
MSKKKLERIYEGWKNLVLDLNKEEAEKRAKVCAACTFNALNTCKVCLCPIPAKTRSSHETCPINKW